MKSLIRNKKGFEFSFSWLFSIIVGAVIIFIAIYATTKLVYTSRTESDTKVAAQIGTLLNPVETNLEDAKYSMIEFPTETRVYNECSSNGNFGRQTISASVRSGIGQEFQTPQVQNYFFNKYLFSDAAEEGEKLYLLVKPFEMPYKVADLVFAYTEDYCFISPPNDIEDDIGSLTPEGINLSSTKSECPAGAKTVCFDELGCDINVNTGSQTVTKDGKTVYYHGPLVYGAIFSSPEIYECQVKRLGKRNAELAHLYASKSDFLSGKGCSSNLAPELKTFASLQVNSSNQLSSVVEFSEDLRRKNENLACRIF